MNWHAAISARTRITSSGYRCVVKREGKDELKMIRCSDIKGARPPVTDAEIWGWERAYEIYDASDDYTLPPFLVREKGGVITVAISHSVRLDAAIKAGWVYQLCRIRRT
jgi:hypothetical protein